jgi:hypothetical protein
LEPAQKLLVALCGSAPAPPAKGINPELVGVAKRFINYTSDIKAALTSYTESPLRNNEVALRHALSSFWATSEGKDALLRVSATDETMNAFTRAYQSGTPSGHAALLLDAVHEFQLINCTPRRSSENMLPVSERDNAPGAQRLLLQ